MLLEMFDYVAFHQFLSIFLGGLARGSGAGLSLLTIYWHSSNKKESIPFKLLIQEVNLAG